ncbi:MAG: cation-translocating P-type ATPase [Myxococcales bacterium]|nr:cation-translocating P-type ATPase [Myxococcales bacterium]
MRPCPTCSRPVDVLRAPAVAILQGKFAYFCSRECRLATDAVSLAPPPVAPRPVPSPAVEPPPEAVEAEETTVEPPPVTQRTPERLSVLSLPALRDDSPVVVVSPPVRLPPVAPVVAPIVAPVVSERPVSTAPKSPPIVESWSPPSSRLPPASPRDSLPTSRLEPPRLSTSSLPAFPSLPPPMRSESSKGADPAPLLRTLALVFSVGAFALALIDPRSEALRLSLSTAAAAALLGLASRDWLRPAARSGWSRVLEHDLGGALAPSAFAAAAMVGLAWGLRMLGKSGSGTALAASVWVVVAAAVAEVVGHASLRPTLEAARGILGALAHDDEIEVGSMVELRVGTAVRADVRILDGRVTLELWAAGGISFERGEGEPVPAGAIVRGGAATARVTATGRDRAFARLLSDALERSDRASPGLRTLDRSAPWVVAALVGFAVAVGLVTRGRIGPTAAAALVAGASMLVPPARRLAVRDQLAGIVEACRRGAAFRDASTFARASGVRSAIICARGTLLGGTPDGCDIEPLGDASRDDVLALAAGVEAGLPHPIAILVGKLADARGIRREVVRNVHVEPGLGVRGEVAGVSGRMQEVVVGSRTHCLHAHVATAEHETRIVELERRGRDVVIVARGGRAIGLLLLQTPLRHGALAAVQRLHDIEVEPVLLGGGTRERLASIGKALDIENVRAEVLPRDRAAEVRRVAQTGGRVAVIGRSDLDGQALGAADVAIALDEAGNPPDLREEPRNDRGAGTIALAHDQLVSAVDVLALAQATRARVSATLLVGLVPVALAALPVALGLVRATYAPLAALAATVALGARDLVAAALPEGERMDDNPG